MRILKHIPTWLRTTLVAQHGATIRHDTEIEVLAMGTPEEVYPGLFTDKNAAIRCRIGEYVTGTVYNKIDLATYWATVYVPGKIGRGLLIKSPVVTCTHDILPEINRYTGFDLAPDEVINLPIADGEHVAVMLQVTPKAIWFTGGIAIPLDSPLQVSEGKPITLIDLDLSIAGLKTPYTGDRINPGVLTYDVNYTDTLMLAAVTAPNGNDPVNPTDGVAIAAMLKRMDGLPWQHISPPAKLTPYNIFNYYVAYNGPVEDYKHVVTHYNYRLSYRGEGYLAKLIKTPREDQMFVLVLAPPPIATNSGLTSDPIFIHYGGPRKVAPDKPAKHYWPLRGTRDNHGTDGEKPHNVLQGQMVCDNAEGLVSLQTRTSGMSMLGVDFPIDKDFTIYFEGKFRSLYPNYAYFKHHSNDTFTFGVAATGGLFLKGTWEVSRVHHIVENTVQVNRHTAFALTRRGDWWLLYVNGEIAGAYKGGTQASKSFNAMYHARLDTGTLLANLAYFDYGMTGDQIRRIHSHLLPPTTEPTKDRVEPLHYWPLQGTFENLGTSKLPLEPFCGFTDVNIDGETSKWAIRNMPTRTKLSVPIKVDRDFTLSFDHHNAVSGMSYSAMFGSDVNTQQASCLWFYNFYPYIYNAIGNNPDDAPRSGANNRIQIVKRGNIVSFYLNGRFWLSQLWLDTSVKEWTYFGAINGYVFSGYQTFKNLRYYDVALNEHQLKKEDGVVYK